MKLEMFEGRDVQRVSQVARGSLGEDAMIVRTRVVRQDGARRVQVVATSAAEVARFRGRLEDAPLRRPAGGEARERPLTLALVGPTGAGKTTTLAKLAVHERAFGTWRVGLLTLDTYRVGALEQLERYADIADLPLEVVYEPGEVPGALDRLSRCDVVLIDTPGRSPRSPEHNADWMQLLAALRPDEVHLVVPAPVRPDVAAAMRAGFDSAGVTHLLLTKLDEVPDDSGVADLALGIELPTRWVTDGQEIPLHLHDAPARIVASLRGMMAAPPRAAVAG